MALSLRRAACAYARAILGYEIRLASETGKCALLEPLRCAGCCWAPSDDLGAASLSAPATAGAIALISGHALHLVVRLVLEKVPGRLPCPFNMRLGSFRSEEEQGLPIDG